LTPIETAYAFVDAINTNDPDRLVTLMTDNHTFIDADGSEHPGRDEMHRGWKQYFAMVPDFKIHVREALSHDNIVALFGVAEGTFDQDGDLKPENHWVVPAAWRVVVERDKVSVWQLYVNPEPMVEIFERIKAS
jgi:ketosteroid isomerase-like protein